MAAVVPDVIGAGRYVAPNGGVWESANAAGGDFSTTPDRSAAKPIHKHRAFYIETLGATDVFRIDGFPYAATDTTRATRSTALTVAWQGMTATDMASVSLGISSSANEVTILSAGADVLGWLHVFYSGGQ